MTVIGEVFVALRGTDGGMQADAEKVVTPALNEVAKKGAQIIGGLALGRALKGQFDEGIAELKDAQAVAAQTAVAIESTGGAANVSAGHVAELAEAGLKLAGVDDELIAKGENVLLSFQSVANEGEGQAAIFDRATAAGLDLATRGFGSVESNAKLLGIALSDPEAGMTRLRRAGIILTEQQKDAIATFASQNNLLGEQEVLLDAVEGKVKGAAKAYGETLGGQVAIAEESIKNARAEIVGSAAPAIELFASGAASAAEFVSELPGPLRDTVAGLGLAVGAWGAVAKPIQATLELWRLFRPAQEAATAATEAAATAEAGQATAAEATAAAEAQAMLASQGASAADLELAASATTAAAAEEGLEAASLGVVGVLALVAAGAGILIGIGSALHDAFSDNVRQQDDYAKALANTTGEVQDNVDQVTAQALVHSKLYDTLKSTGVATVDIFTAVKSGTDDWGEYGRQIDRVRTSGQSHEQQIRSVTTALRGAGAGNDAFSKSLLDGLQSGKLTVDQVGHIVDEMEGLHNGYQGATSEAAKNKEATDAVAEAHVNSAAAVQLDADAIDELEKAHAAMPDLIDQVAGAMDRSYESTLTAAKGSIAYHDQIDKLTKSIHDNGLTLDDTTEKGRANLTQAFSTGESIAKLIEQRFEETHSVEAATAAGNLYVANLEEQLRQAGLTDEQVQQYIDTMNLTPEDINTIFTNDAVEQQIVIGKYIAELDKVPPSIRSQIEAEINRGEFDLANQQLDDLAQGRTVDFNVVVHANGQLVFTAPDGTVTNEVDFGVRQPGPRAAGGSVFAGELYDVNEGLAGTGRRELFRPAMDGVILSADQVRQEQLAALGAGRVSSTAEPAVLVQVDARGNPDGWQIGRTIGEGLDDHRWRWPHR